MPMIWKIFHRKPRTPWEEEKVIFMRIKDDVMTISCFGLHPDYPVTTYIPTAY